MLGSLLWKIMHLLTTLERNSPFEFQ